MKTSELGRSPDVETEPAQAKWWLCLIVIAAAVLRMPAYYGSLPDVYWHDELNFVEGALRVGGGEIQGVSFGGYAHGSLTYFVLFIAFGVWFVVAWALGVVSGPQAFLLAYVTDHTGLFLVARTVMLAASLGTVWLTYVIARRLFDWRSAIFATVLMAVSFLAVHMTFGKEDGFYSFLLLASFFLATYAVERPDGLRLIFLTGVLLGATAAVKYFAIIGWTTLAIMAWMGGGGRWRNTARTLAVGLAGFALALVLLMPDLVLNPGGVAQSVLTLKRGNAGILMADTAPPAAWYDYLWSTYTTTEGIVLAALFWIGALLVLWEQRGKGLLLMAYPFSLALVLSVALLQGSAVAAPYYQLSTIPFFCMAAGRVLARLSESSRMVIRASAFVLLSIVVASNVEDAVRFHRLLGAKDSRTLVREWIEAHVSKGSSILVEGAILSFVLEGPQLKENAVSLERDLHQIHANGGTGRIWLAKLQAFHLQDSPRPTYDLHKVRDLSADDLRTIGADYVVVRSDRGHAIVEEAPETYDLVFSVHPPAPKAFRYIPLMSMVDLKELRKIPVVGSASPPIMPGPAIWVYRSPRSADGVLSLRK